MLVFRSFNIRGGRLDLTDKSFTTLDEYHQRTQRAAPQPGDLIITREAPMGQVALIPEGVRGCLGQRLVLLRPSPDRMMSAFMLYALLSPAVQQQISTNEGTGSTVSNLRIPVLSALKIPCPEIAAQRAIARILGALDDKIELNRRTNETLEAMARALFQSWFVDFDPVRAKMEGRQPEGMDAETAKLFPSSFEDSELGPIPAGWRAATLADAVKSGVGGELQTGPFGSQLHASDYVEEGIPSIMPKDIIGGRLAEDSMARVSEADAERLAQHRLRLGDLVFSRRGDVEKHALVRDHEKGWLCGTGCLRIRLGSDGVEPLLASQWLGTPFAREWLVRHAVGATMPNLNTTILGSIPFLLPSRPIQLAYAQAATPLDRLSTGGVSESRTLTTLRDALLPKLLSGELRVPDAERLASEVL